MYDVIIVGARCAGAALASFLGRLGIDVLLMDKYESPGPTLSTHVLGDTEVYERLRIKERIEASGAPPLTRMRVDLEGRVFESDLVVTERALGLRRELLDSYLLETAASCPNVTVRLQSRVTSLIWEHDRVMGIRYLDSKRRPHSCYAKVVIGADGRHSTVSRQVDAKKNLASSENHLAVFFAYFNGVTPLPLPAMEWYWNDEEIVLCNPIDRDQHCLVLMVKPEKRKDESLTSFFLNYLHNMKTLSPRLTRASLAGRIKGAHHLESYMRQAWGNGWALVGDAGAHLHPVSGIGIDNAICCAEMLAEKLAAFLQGNMMWEEAMKEYTIMRDERILPQYEACLATLRHTQAYLSEAQLQALDVLCTFPSQVKKLARKSDWLHE